MYVEFSLMPRKKKIEILELMREAKNDFSFFYIDEFGLGSNHESYPLLPPEE